MSQSRSGLSQGQDHLRGQVKDQFNTLFKCYRNLYKASEPMTFHFIIWAGHYKSGALVNEATFLLIIIISKDHLNDGGNAYNYQTNK